MNVIILQIHKKEKRFLSSIRVIVSYYQSNKRTKVLQRINEALGLFDIEEYHRDDCISLLSDCEDDDEGTIGSDLICFK